MAAAAIGNGLPKTSLVELLTDLTTGDTADMLKIPGITTAIVESSALALKHASLDSVHDVWYACCAFAAIGLIRKSFMLPSLKNDENLSNMPNSFSICPGPCEGPQ